MTTDAPHDDVRLVDEAVDLESTGTPQDDLRLVDEIVQQAIGRSARDRQSRRRLPGGGRLFVDGRAPFLAVYREPADADPGGDRFARALRSYLVLPHGQEAVGARICSSLGAAILRQLGVALIIELWTSGAVPAYLAGHVAPRIAVHAGDPDGALAATFADALGGLAVVPETETDVGLDRAEVVRELAPEPAPPGLAPLIPHGSDAPHIDWIGIEVPRTFRSDSAFFPRRLTFLLRNLATAIERAVFAWAGPRIRVHPPGDPDALGRQSLGRTARAIEGRIGQVARSFDLVLGASPVNGPEMWEQFRSSGESVPPRFKYRPLDFDPEALKRSLFHVPLERIEDPLVADLVREKQEEIDLRISMLRARGTHHFFLGSLQLFGRPDDDLVALATDLMARPSGRGEEDTVLCEPGESVDATAFVAHARAEIAHYRAEHADFPSEIELRDDISSGLLVSDGTLCIRSTLCLDPRRAEALLQHEVGTHMVTYYNGSRQPLRLLGSGLAYYGALQEGLAVLSEHLVDGLTRSRLRTLAARVLAVRARVEEADFVEVYRRLVDMGVRRRAAFSIVVRVFRGGGLTKDAQYLAGLRDLLAYLRDGGPLRTLLVGKVGFSHLDVVAQLAARGVVTAPAIVPRYAEAGPALERLEECRSQTVTQLFEEASP